MLSINNILSNSLLLLAQLFIFLLPSGAAQAQDWGAQRPAKSQPCLFRAGSFRIGNFRAEVSISVRRTETPCPASGIVTGTITAADVIVLPSTNGDSVIPQGIPPGDFAGLIKAIHSDDNYINVHTTNFPSGEIRGQVHLDE